MPPHPTASPLDLLLPTRCAGCARLGAACCPRCLAGVPLRLDETVVPLPAGDLLSVSAATDYDGTVRRLLLAYKETGRLDLAPVLGGLLAPAVLGAALRRGPPVRPGDGDPGRLGSGRRGRGRRGSGRQGAVRLELVRLELVPVPSRSRSRRRRGADLVLLLARAAAARLRSHGWSVRVTPVLRHTGGGVDQVGLDRRQRARNAAASLEARPGRGATRTAGTGTATTATVTTGTATTGLVTTGTVVLVVDDILTTGATVREAARALADAGRPVAGAAVVAATPLPGTTRPGG